MCLILFSYEQHSTYRLILAANRDESYDRPTAPAAFWEGDQILAGRDLEAGGTWMGVTRTGRWAAVTNFRDFTEPVKTEAPSRGRLVTRFLNSSSPPAVFAAQLKEEADRYNGFSLLLGTPDAIAYFSNRDNQVKQVGAGLYGLSNHLLDTDWPKVERGKQALSEVMEARQIDPDELLDILADRRVPSDEKLPNTGLDLERERMVAPIFIESAGYGTRSSTVLLISRTGQVTFVERSYGMDEEETRRFDFPVVASPVT